MFDEEQNLYSYQYTLLSIYFGFITAQIAMVALTDFKNKHHYYLQCPAGKNWKLHVSEIEVSFGNIASVTKQTDHMRIKLVHKNFSLDLKVQYGKGAFWHCDDGKLQMGIPGEKETTLYYSYTNMPTSGKLVLDGKEVRLTGKTWFDKQGGSYSIRNLKTHWEWFSLRFFDDEEIMLFTFPQDTHFDGTYITKDCKRERLDHYKIERTGTLRAFGMKWSSGWKLHLEKKEKDYVIEPIQQGHMNFAYFEELCYVKNIHGEIVGYFVTELLPGVLNGDWKTKDECGKDVEKVKITNLLKRIEL